MTNRLEIRLLNYFLLIALAAIMIGIEFFFEMGQKDLKQKICETPAQYLSETPIADKNHSATLTSLRNKIVVMFGVLTLVVAIVMTMFIKNITMPLQKMVDAAKHINEGDLSHVIEVNSQDEIGMVGKAINELTSNLQECATFTCITANEALEKIEKLESRLNATSDNDINEIREIQLSLKSLVEFADSFQLLHTDINHHA